MTFDSTVANDTSWIKEGIWTQAVTLVEMHADSLLEMLFAVEMEKLSEGPYSLMRRELSESGKTWTRRTDAFKLITDFRVRSLPSWGAMNAIIFVRNSIAHGDGKVTRQQTVLHAREAAKILDLALVDRKFHIDDLALRSAIETCVLFVCDIDSGVPRGA